MMVFVDTSAWFAFFVQSDPHHSEICDLLSRGRQQLVTTDYCVDETLTLLIARRQHRRALEAGDFFFQSGLCRLHFLTPDEVRRAWLIFEQRSAAGWSFTDCTSKIVIDKLGIRTAIALDAHFQEFGDVVIAP
jgi:uncharacterized protein